MLVQVFYPLVMLRDLYTETVNLSYSESLIWLSQLDSKQENAAKTKNFDLIQDSGEWESIFWSEARCLKSRTKCRASGLANSIFEDWF